MKITIKRKVNTHKHNHSNKCLLTSYISFNSLISWNYTINSNIRKSYINKLHSQHYRKNYSIIKTPLERIFYAPTSTRYSNKLITNSIISTKPNNIHHCPLPITVSMIPIKLIKLKSRWLNNKKNNWRSLLKIITRNSLKKEYRHITCPFTTYLHKTSDILFIYFQLS